jgi:hypothetical protein
MRLESATQIAKIGQTYDRAIDLEAVQEGDLRLLLLDQAADMDRSFINEYGSSGGQFGMQAELTQPHQLGEDSVRILIEEGACT